MKPLRYRDDLIAMVARHVPSRACATALREDRATVLGGFTPAGRFPSYFVKVRSKHGREWLACVECDEDARKYTVSFPEDQQVPWESWQGEREGKRPLIDGDDPAYCATMKARSDGTQETTAG